jgi:sphingomyelin phosphodiesterase
MLIKIKPLLLLILLLPALQALNPICALCHDVVKAVQRSVPLAPPVLLVDAIGTTVCTRQHMQTKNVCKGAVREMVPLILNSAWMHYSDPHLICSELKMCPQEYTKRNLDADVAKILQGRPDKTWEKPTLRKKLKIMHISDLHIDLFYTPGMPSRCTEPVCCRVNSTSRPNETTKAGYWGSLDDCDLPIQTF